MRDHVTHHDDCGCQSAALKDRIATLEAELAASRTARDEERRSGVTTANYWMEQCDDSRERRVEAVELWQLWQAHATTLRDALAEMRSPCEWGATCADRPNNRCPSCVDAQFIDAALLATPAQSLAAHDAEVLERAAAVADAYDGDGVSKSGLYTQLGDGALTRSDIANAIRALAAQEVKP